MPLQPGDKLGPYEILALVGKGGMGEVYRARDPRLKRDVAIKVSAAQFSERFEREAQAIAALNHPNICQLYDVGPNYLVMEYIEGTPLKGPLPVDQALKYATQICDALDAAHKKGITHRDLKPGNILVTASGVKLLDFGLAKIALGKIGTAGAPPAPDAATQTIGLTEAGTILGTAAYMSPEQARGEEVDTRSDIFSLGLVLYEMLSGRRAFSKNSAIETMAAIVRDEPAPLDAPAELVRIVTRCLRKAPAERFQSAAELRSALADVKIGPAAEQPSIAVLPFANLSADKDNEYFSDGLAEEILNGLTPLPGLRVIARTSAFAFRGREHAISEIGQKLRVGCVLQGSVRRSGNRIRVNVQLINVSDESQLWSERYDRELRDVFDIQDEIAQAIVEKLKVKLGTRAGQPLVKRYTENLEAHSLYLKGNFYLYRLWSVDDMEKARDYLEQAVALEPGYAPAWVLLTDYHIARSVHAVAHPREELPKGLEAARRAVAADEALAEAQAALAWHEAAFRFDWTRGLDRFETALRLNPASARSHFWHGVTLCGLSRVEESVAAMRRAVELDPLATLFHSYLANQYIWAGEYERAADHGRQALEIEPDYGMALAALGEAYSYLGRPEEGINLLEKARKVLPGDFWPTAFLGGAYIRTKRRSQAERLLAELEEKRHRRYVSAASIVIIASALGDADRAVKLLDQAVDDHDPNLMHLAPSPYLKSLRSASPYQHILRRMNLVSTGVENPAQ